MNMKNNAGFKILFEAFPSIYQKQHTYAIRKSPGLFTNVTRNIHT